MELLGVAPGKSCWWRKSPLKLSRVDGQALAAGLGADLLIFAPQGECRTLCAARVTRGEGHTEVPSWHSKWAARWQ